MIMIRVPRIPNKFFVDGGNGCGERELLYNRQYYKLLHTAVRLYPSCTAVQKNCHCLDKVDVTVMNRHAFALQQQ